MNNTQTFVLAGRVYTLETSAAERLTRYVNDLKSHFAASSERDEIVNDIELRIAEKFSALREKGATVITDADVHDVLETVGNPIDMTEGAGIERSAQDTAPRRLRRDARNGVLGGVCAGLAEYFSVDPIIMRIAAVVLAFVTGILLIVLIYVVLWIALPDKSNRNADSGKSIARISVAIFVALLAIPALIISALLTFRLFFGIAHIETNVSYDDWATLTQTNPTFSIMYPEDSLVDDDLILLPSTENDLERTMKVTTRDLADPSLDGTACVITGTHEDSGTHIVNAGGNEFCLRTIDEVVGSLHRRTYFYTIPDENKVIETAFTVTLPVKADVYEGLDYETTLFIDIIRTLQK